MFRDEWQTDEWYCFGWDRRLYILKTYHRLNGMIPFSSPYGSPHSFVSVSFIRHILRLNKYEEWEMYDHFHLKIFNIVRYGPKYCVCVFFCGSIFLEALYNSVYASWVHIPHSQSWQQSADLLILKSILWQLLIISIDVFVFVFLLVFFFDLCFRSLNSFYFISVVWP